MVNQNQDNKDNVVLIGQWERRGHFEKFLAWREENGGVDTLEGMLAQPASFRFFDKTEV